MKSFKIFFCAVVVMLVGCSNYYQVERTTTVYPDGRKVVVEKPVTKYTPYYYQSNYPYYYSSYYRSYNIGYGGYIGCSPRINYGGNDRGYRRTGRRR